MSILTNDKEDWTMMFANDLRGHKNPSVGDQYFSHTTSYPLTKTNCCLQRGFKLQVQPFYALKSIYNHSSPFSFIVVKIC